MLGSQPVAWAALNDDGEIAWIGYTEEAAADGSSGRPIVPLYRKPPLTDEEREAIEIAIPFLPDGPYTEYDGTPRPDRRATLRGLLERTK